MKNCVANSRVPVFTSSFVSSLPAISLRAGVLAPSTKDTAYNQRMLKLNGNKLLSFRANKKMIWLFVAKMESCWPVLNLTKKQHNQNAECDK